MADRQHNAAVASQVRRAIRRGYGRLEGSGKLRNDPPGYVFEPQDNLLPSLTTSVLDDCAAGAGGELEGDPPKFCALHSSSALAVNSFAPMRLHPERFALAGLKGFEEARFEQKLPTGLRGTAPHLDFFVRGPTGLVAVESKFTEILSPKRAVFSPSYAKAIERLADDAWASVYRALIRDPAWFVHLDAAQLLKHYLGIRHSARGAPGRHVLLYVFWEPSNGEEIAPFSKHRDEVTELADLVADSSVEFVASSYSDLWAAWEKAGERSGIRSHVEALRRRYELRVLAE